MNKKNNKVRTRSKKELKIRKAEFLKICKILTNLNIKYFLQTGILLGAIRDNDLIPWDWDVEISVFSKDVNNKLDELIKKLKKSGFGIEKYSKENSTLKIDFIGKLEKEVNSYTIKGWNHNKKKKLFWRRSYKIPEYFLLNMKKIKFFNKYHFVPYPTEKFLEYQYGNWKIPIKSSDKTKYMTNKYSGINKFIYRINQIKRNISKILS